MYYTDQVKVQIWIPLKICGTIWKLQLTNNLKNLESNLPGRMAENPQQYAGTYPKTLKALTAAKGCSTKYCSEEVEYLCNFSIIFKDLLINNKFTLWKFTVRSYWFAMKKKILTGTICESVMCYPDDSNRGMNTFVRHCKRNRIKK